MVVTSLGIVILTYVALKRLILLNFDIYQVVGMFIKHMFNSDMANVFWKIRGMKGRNTT